MRSDLKGKRWARFRSKILKRDEFRCQRCGAAGKLEIHHRKPMHEGGETFDADNCETLCRECHIRHHNPESRERKEWREFFNDNYEG